MFSLPKKIFIYIKEILTSMKVMVYINDEYYVRYLQLQGGAIGLSTPCVYNQLQCINVVESFCEFLHAAQYPAAQMSLC